MMVWRLGVDYTSMNIYGSISSHAIPLARIRCSSMSSKKPFNSAVETKHAVLVIILESRRPVDLPGKQPPPAYLISLAFDHPDVMVNSSSNPTILSTPSFTPLPHPPPRCPPSSASSERAPSSGQHPSAESKRPSQALQPGINPHQPLYILIIPNQSHSHLFQIPPMFVFRESRNGKWALS
jgi:hypothetical protein